MITYKNISFSAKTFYGVRFEPGEINSVPGYINSSGMIRVTTPQTTAQPNKPIPHTEPTGSKRGRKPKSAEPEKVEVAETQEIKIEISEEETSNGNQC